MRPSLTVVYTDIGRGHPNYLDSVLRYIRQNHPAEFRQLSIESALRVSRGFSRLAWLMVQGAYRTGGRGGPLSSLYTYLRSRRGSYTGNSAVERLLRRDLLRALDGQKTACLVAHPLLGNMLKEYHRVLYLHGEIAAPLESKVTGAERIYVPLPQTRRKMMTMGVRESLLVETGLVLEPELCENRDSVGRERIRRLGSNTPLTVGIFISGAYPKKHVHKIAQGTRSCLQAGMNVRLFWGTDRRQVRRLLELLDDQAENAIIDDVTTQGRPEGRLICVTADSREAETLRSMEYMPSLDVFCAAPHERVNWAVGAGLPMVMITPPIGSFARQNCEFVLQSGCGIELSERRRFAALAQELTSLRQNGQLTGMADSGLRIKEIHGARRIAEDLLTRVFH